MTDMIPWERLVDYGMGLIALVMMYSITFNHLTTIEKTLIEIRNILSKGQD